MAAVALSMTLNASAALEKKEMYSKRDNSLYQPAVSSDAQVRRANNFGGGGWDDPRSEGDEALGGPVGDSVWLILGLGLSYGIYVFGRRKKA